METDNLVLLFSGVANASSPQWSIKAGLTFNEQVFHCSLIALTSIPRRTLQYMLVGRSSHDGQWSRPPRCRVCLALDVRKSEPLSVNAVPTKRIGGLPKKKEMFFKAEAH